MSRRSSTRSAEIGDYYFYQTFLFFVHLSGIIPVVAAAFTLMRLSRFNELTALLAAGVPLLRIAMPIVLAGVVLNGLMIVDQEVVIPALLPKLTRSHDDVHRTDVKTFPIQAMQDSNRALLYAGRYTPPGPGRPATMDKVDVVERGEADPVPVELATAGSLPAGPPPPPKRPTAGGRRRPRLTSPPTGPCGTRPGSGGT